MQKQLTVERTPATHSSDLPSAAMVLGQASAENFPVASRLLPRAVREHLLAIYGFARLADDIGDEIAGNRLEWLDWLDSELELAARGEATHPLMQKLSPTIERFDLPLDPFHRLVEANRWDQTNSRYETFDDLVAYCRLSATPVGELVLRVFEVSTPERIALSDDVCIALQVVEHLQDVGEDAGRDRIYLPQSDLHAFGCAESDLRAGGTSSELRSVLRYEAGKARRLLASAKPLTRQLPLQACVAVCGFAAGGLAALDSMERAGFEVLGQRCRPRPVNLVARMAGALVAASTKRSR